MKATDLLSSLPSDWQTVPVKAVPVGSIFIFMPLLVSMVMPPMGRSLRVMVQLSVFRTFISATAGVAGSSPWAQKHPVQMG